MWRMQVQRLPVSSWSRSSSIHRALRSASCNNGGDSLLVVRLQPPTTITTIRSSSSKSSSFRCFSTASIDDINGHDSNLDRPLNNPTKIDPSSKWLRPSEVVRELDKHIVGQQDAKRTIANAFRMRWRRRQLPADLKKEVKPRNVLLIGPTGCGKTEIARKMADLCKAPFIKVEATKYTEVGYHGRDVDQIIRDLVENAIHLVRKEKTEEFREQAKEMVEEILLDELVGKSSSSSTRRRTTGAAATTAYDDEEEEEDDEEDDDDDDDDEDDNDANAGDKKKKKKKKSQSEDTTTTTDGPKASPSSRNRDSFRELLQQGVLDNQTITIDIPRSESGGAPVDRSFGRGGGTTDSSPNVVLDAIVKGLRAAAVAAADGRDKSSSSSSSNTEKRQVTIAEARELLLQIQVDKLLETVDLKKEAIEAVEERGIAFIDEIDKIVMPREAYRNTDASAEGVQRDLLPVVEGTTIDTKYGNINTDHILFIASGAFHAVKPSDMLPELQGRFPIRVELKGLGENDLYRILTEPVANLVLQQVELMKTEGVSLVFTEDGTREIARLAALANKEMENIGARRLHTVMERIVDQVSYEAPDMDDGAEIIIDKKFVSDRLQDMVVKSDQSKYIL